MKQFFLPCNFAPRPTDTVVDLIVIHVMAGTASSALNWFRNPASRVSAHYGITLAGEEQQYVREEHVAYHAGISWARTNGGPWAIRGGPLPTFPLVAARPGQNPNTYSIGIEHEGTGKDRWPEAQVAASIELVADIAFRHQFPQPLAAHVARHHDIWAGHACPGATCPFDAIVMGAQMLLNRKKALDNPNRLG